MHLRCYLYYFFAEVWSFFDCVLFFMQSRIAAQLKGLYELHLYCTYVNLYFLQPECEFISLLQGLFTFAKFKNKQAIPAQI